MALQTYLAVDIGAGSGRVVPGTYDGKTLHLGELHRFANRGLHLPTGWHWNLAQLFADVKSGLAVAHRRYGDSLVSVAIDTWAVDYGLLDQRGRLLGLPWMYRDARTDGMVNQVDRRVPPSELYRRTGIQPLFFNTIYQLCAELRDHPATVQAADRLLFVPDLLTYWLSGERITERTNASTSQLLKSGAAEWDHDLMATLGLPARIFQTITEPGTGVGRVRAEVTEETGGGRLRVVACGSHDTASAVAGVPSDQPHPLFLSSGTWSLVGRELAAPILTEEARGLGFSNEQGLAGTTRFLKNVAGMWLLQECRRAWDAEGAEVSLDALLAGARGSGIRSVIDPDATGFRKPGNMPAAIADYLTRTGQARPDSPGDMTRIILRSLALKYRAVVGDLRRLMPDLPRVLHVVGGGSQNSLLNQMTADATGLRVVAGPMEATAAGNILAQLLAAGEIHSLAEGRKLIRASFCPVVHEPGDSAPWDEAAEAFNSLPAN